MMRFPIRGGNWNNGSNAGLAALNLNNPRSNANSNIGFRPALDEARNSRLKGCCQSSNEKDAAASAIAEKLNQVTDASVTCLYEQIYDFDNLLSAAYSCKRGKSKKKATLKFFSDLEENLIQLQNELVWGMYKVGEYHHFYVFEPKRRLISAPTFKDRVVQRAIYNVIEPIFDKSFIFDSYACRRGKGTHKGADRAQSFIRKVQHQSGRAFALKADIYHYFSSIDHSVLKTLLERRIKCPRTLALLSHVIDASPSEMLGVGIPLGNLTSQVFANVYLHELDRFVKHYLKVTCYVRYMDDFVIIHQDKRYLYRCKLAIEGYLARNLRLCTNSKTQVFPISTTNGRALDFLGYRIYGSHRLLRKSSVNTIRTKLKKYRIRYKAGDMSMKEINAHINSWLGHAKHANSYGLRCHLLKQPFIKG
ncbi:TPA: reverse transcriptase domain-containing protein [Photobacterium damselae]